MGNVTSNPEQPMDSRRRFIKGATTSAIGAHLALQPQFVHASGDETLKVGLIGCGRRGRGAVVNALMADPQTRLVSLGDVFADQIDESHRVFAKDAQEVSERIDVPSERCFVGFDAYQGVIETADVILLASPPHFRPKHLQACVEANKHVFAEKPVAVDALGVRKIQDACRLAERKGVAVVSGLCWRYDTRARAAMAQVHDGAVGRIVALQSSYNSARPGKAWPMIRKDNWGEMEQQIRNWYWFTWLSGDHIVEQAIHSMDKGAWSLHDETPRSAVSLGGLQAREAPELGTIFDHHAVVYEHGNGLKHFHYCRQQPGCANDVSTHVIGTDGICHIERGIIRDHEGSVTWKYSGPSGRQMHQAEHDELFASIRSGTPINNGDYMAKSTMLAILGRMASYSGRKIRWEDAIQSQEELSPPEYDWSALPKIPPIAIPGVPYV